MATKDKLVFLFDVDNTLLDNDRVTADLKRHLELQVGPDRSARYWEIFEQLRDEIGYADYLGALQRYRAAFTLDDRVACRRRLHCERRRLRDAHLFVGQ